MNFRPTKILVPTDLSEDSWQALDAADSLAREYEANLSFLNVIEDPRYFQFYHSQTAGRLTHDIDQVRQEAVRSALDAMKRMTETRFPDRHVEIETVFHPRPGIAICEHARERGHDLVVLASHGRTGLRRFFLGSTAEAVVRRAHIPVVLVPCPEE